MGNQTPKFPRYQWVYLKSGSNYSLFHNNHGLIAQKYELNQQKNISSNQELQIYKQRSESLSPIVKVYYAQIDEQKKNFCSSFQKLTVYTQHISYRLTDIKSFTLSQNKVLYILKQSLKGFDELFNKFGYFEISNQLIGFNQNGEVRVWVNSQIESNRVQKGKNSIIGMGSSIKQNDISKIDKKTRQKLQKDMVSDIWRYVKGKSNINNRQIYQRLSTLQNCTFQHANQTITMFLANTNTERIPNKLNFPNSIQNQTVHSLLNYSYELYAGENCGNNQMNQFQQKLSDLVEVYDKQFLGRNRIARNMMFKQPQFNNFQEYREFIDQLHPKKKQKSQEKVENKQNTNPEQLQKKKLNIDKIIDISLSSIPQQSSNRSIPNSNDINSFKNIPQIIPQLGAKRVSSYIFPQNAVTQTFIRPLQSQQPFQYTQNRNTNYKDSQIPLWRSPSKNQYYNPQNYNRKPIFTQKSSPPLPLMSRKQGVFISPTHSRIVVQPQTPKFQNFGNYNNNY